MYMRELKIINTHKAMGMSKLKTARPHRAMSS